MSFLSKFFKGVGKIFKDIFKFIAKIFTGLFGSKKTPKENDGELNEELLNTTAQPTRASPVLYGRGRVAGNRVYQNISSQTNTKLLTVLSFGVGQISEITAVRIEKNKVSDTVNSNTVQIQAINNKYNAEIQNYIVTSPQGWKTLSNPAAVADINARREAEINSLNAASAPVQLNKWVQIETRLGSITQSAMSLADAHSNELTSASCGYGHVLLALLQTKDQGTNEFQNAQSDVAIDYVGRSILDLRNMNIIAGCSNGPSVLWDFLTSNQYGCGYTVNELDFSSFVKAANQVAVSFNGAIDLSKTRKQAVEAICSSFGGELTLINGKITLVLDYSATEYVYLNDDVIVGQMSHESDVITNRFNGVDVNWVNPDVDYQQQTLRYPPNFDQDPQIAREGHNLKKFDLPYTINKTDVDRMSSFYLNQRLIDETVTFNAIGFGTHVEVGNVIAMTVTEKGWTNKLWRVVRTDKKLTQGAINQIQIQAKEYIPEVYNTVYTGAIIPDSVSAIYANSSLVTNVRVQMLPAEMGSAVRLRWDYTQNFVSGRFMVAYKPSASSEWIVADDGVLGNMCDLYNLVPATRYDFRVCNVNKMGRQGPWVTISGFNTADIISMPVVTNLRLVNKLSDAEPTFANSREFVIAWDDVRNSSIIVDQYAGDATGAMTASRLIRTYRVEVYEGARFKGTYDTTDPQFTYTYERNNADGLSRNNTFKVRVVGHNGQVGNAVELITKNPQCRAVMGMTDTAVMGNVFLKWAQPIDADYVGVLIYASDKPNVELSPANFKARSYITNSYSIDFNYLQGATAFIKYGAYDEFGEDEIVWTEQAVLTKGWPTESQLDKDLKDKINAPITVDRLSPDFKVNTDMLGDSVKAAIDQAAVGMDVLHSASQVIEIDTEEYFYNFVSPFSSMAEVTIAYKCANGGMVPVVQRLTSYADGNDMIYLQTVREGKQSAAVGYVAKGANKLRFFIKGCSPTNKFVITAIAFKASSTESVYHPIRTTKIQLVDKIETAEKAQIQELNLLKATFNDNVTATNSKFDSVTATLNGSIATSIDSLRTDFNNTSSALNTRINNVESSANASLSTKVDELNSKIVTTNGTIQALDLKLSSTKTDLLTAITQSENRSSASIALANGRVDSLITTVNLNKAKADESMAGIQTTLEANMNTTKGSIASLTSLVNTNKVSTDNALATQKTQLEATIEASKSSAKAEMDLSVDAKLGSSFVVKTDVNGKFAGFGLINKPNTGSTFRIQADKFIIDDGNAGDAPFIVEAGNTYIRSALIKNATIVNAHIADGSITSAKIANASIDNAKIAGVISSPNYDWNNGNIKGWAIVRDDGNGNGGMYCGSGVINNMAIQRGTIRNADIQSGSIMNLYAENITGKNIVITSGTVTGTINANNGTFNNVTINGNCSILGRLDVSQINGNFSNAQALSQQADQTLYFGADWYRGRTLIVTGIDIGATGWEQTVGNDGRTKQYTGNCTCSIYVNDRLVGQRTVYQRGGGDTNWRNVGATAHIPAGNAPKVRILIGGAGWSYYLDGAVAMIV